MTMLRAGGCVRRSALALIVAVGAIGCAGPAHRRVRPEGESARGPEWTAPPGESSRCDLRSYKAGCRPAECGTNSSYLTGAALDALSLDGCRNRDGVRLVPGTLRADDDACRDRPEAFAILGGRIVAGVPRPRAAPPGPRAAPCEGRVREGATFWIEGDAEDLPSPPDGVPAERRVRQELQVVRIDEATGADHATGAAITLPAYVIEPTGATLVLDRHRQWHAGTPRDARGAGSPRRDLCRHASRWMAPWSGTGTPPRSSAACDVEVSGSSATATVRCDHAAAGVLADVARDALTIDDQEMLIADGEVYDNSGSLHGPQPDEPARWFHLACAGSVLGKARLMGLSPHAGGSTVEERVAAHKMMMAWYCDGPTTTSGTPLFKYDSLSDSERQQAAMTEEQAARIGPLEALWGERGALCVEHSRLWRKDVPPPAFALGLFERAGERGRPRGPEPSLADAEASFVEHVRSSCGIPSCGELLRRRPAASREPHEWISRTVDHIEHVVPPDPSR